MGASRRPGSGARPHLVGGGLFSVGDMRLACTRHLRAYKGPNGIAFNSREGYADMPLTLRCGACIGCRIDRQTGWMIRMMHELQMAEKACFATFTYNDDCVPDDHGLRVEHWQEAAKRIRANIGDFRFFMAAEYGGDKLRPHYHAAIFGQDFTNDRVRVNVKGSPHYWWTNEAVTSAWRKGYVTVGELNSTTARYICNYMLKKVTGKKAKAAYERIDPLTGETWDVRPEFSTMSRRPGLGASWFDRYCDDVYPQDVVVLDGKKYRPPQFYDRLLQDRDPAMWRKVEARRNEWVQKHSEDLTPDRLEVKERIINARQSLFAKDR